ncbi:hypothetical protein C497_01480 [Halalkalicoccus jeotgali B3]|uniref:Uncharacterized protein n=1 Tax=Halalkalicoccus jeotgali (strain DSM 18796 / CECT 7217 / JCM 14584 / KCTC 4019 / B3) TaxID=795797 RepID=D8JB62_HALJB|nr:hypothetical protein HacjB3_15776 [Halalkalicoccus jeotgali B3]ELY41390.1 hypothetical protein C497_01480 [Halalkalicoccus jeotgali B3]
MFGVLFDEWLLMIPNTSTSGIVFDDIKLLKLWDRFLNKERFEVIIVDQ